jgi:hypothetical protein
LGQLTLLMRLVITYKKKKKSFGLYWVRPNTVANLLACWSIGSSTRSAAMWKMVPFCLFWCLWKEINDKIYEVCKSTLAELGQLSL